jgi:hypothetical protein
VNVAVRNTALSGFRLPSGDQRVTFIGRTGSGKTQMAAYFLSRANLHARPWIIVDTKGERIFQMVGKPWMQDLALRAPIPKKPGLYIVHVNPWQDAELDDFLLRVWAHENCGLFIDEAMQLPRKSALSAIMRQGRSKRIPVLACTQRPVDCERELFSEADYFCVFGLNDPRDYKVVEGFAPVDFEAPTPPYVSQYYSISARKCFFLRPAPPQSTIVAEIRAAAPRPNWTFFPRWNARY